MPCGASCAATPPRLTPFRGTALRFKSLDICHFRNVHAISISLSILRKIRRERDLNPRCLLGTHDFQSCTFDHSDISPKKLHYLIHSIPKIRRIFSNGAGPVTLLKSNEFIGAHAMLHLPNNPLTGSRAAIWRGGFGLRSQTSCLLTSTRLRPLSGASMRPFPPAGRRGLRFESPKLSRLFPKS